MTGENHSLQIPDRINTLSVYAFVRDPYDWQLALVICRLGRAPIERDTYVVWRLYTTTDQHGITRWSAESGHYDLSWPRALQVLAERCGVLNTEPA